MPGKRVQFHPEVLARLEELADDREATFQELADEAFKDLLKKHEKPVGVRAMLKDRQNRDAGMNRRRAELGLTATENYRSKFLSLHFATPHP